MQSSMSRSEAQEYQLNSPPTDGISNVTFGPNNFLLVSSWDSVSQNVITCRYKNILKTRNGLKFTPYNQVVSIIKVKTLDSVVLAFLLDKAIKVNFLVPAPVLPFHVLCVVGLSVHELRTLNLSQKSKSHANHQTTLTKPPPPLARLPDYTTQ